ncbi:MAG: hypothetical protein JXX28_03435 [Deltaproteobacteria bacterium]|nr:hypothetical protein [Deltaproteobacteria bacterium]
MPTPLNAFHVGYGLNLVGTYFETADMILRIADGGDEALKALCQEQLLALSQQGASTRWQLKRVQAAMEEAALPAPSAPETYQDYEAWTEAVSSTYYGALSEDAHHAAYLLGWYLSVWVQAANQGVIALFLLDAAEDGAPITEERDAIQAVLQGASEDLAQTLDGAPLPPEALKAALQALEAIRKAPPLDDGEQELLDVADDYQEALHEITEVVERLEELL